MFELRLRDDKRYFFRKMKRGDGGGLGKQEDRGHESERFSENCVQYGCIIGSE